MVLPVDTTITQRLADSSRPLLSYEFFPPKTEAGLISLQATIEGLAETSPDFATVTYGAGGSTRSQTLEISEWLRRFDYRPVMPHLTCVGNTRDELREIADEIYVAGFRNIMTLRGDPPKGETSFVPPADGLSCARDLVTCLKQWHPEFCLGVAGYPEGHPEAKSEEAEMAYLKSKVDAGADFITTQLFFDNRVYFSFVERCRDAGIRVPIFPGVMPALSVKQVQRMTTFCKAELPAGLLASLEAAGGEGESAESAGILWCTQQIVDLLKHDVPGIHLYILNKVRPAMAYKLAQTFMELTGA